MIDTHAHLDFPEFADDLEQVLAAADAAGIRRIVNIGTDLKSSKGSVELAVKHQQIFAAVGFHPHDARHFDSEAEKQIRDLANNFKVVAIGEIGLDFYRDHSPRDTQREVFRKQIALAREISLPIVIHIREAYREAIDMLAEEKAYEVNVVLHCFSGSRDDAFRALDYGFYLSIGGVLTFTNSRLGELVRELPIEHILLETDAPFLTPHPHRGRRNQPAYVELVYRKLAEILNRDFREIEATIDRNAETFFEFE